jgi:hypothetical protein
MSIASFERMLRNERKARRLAGEREAATPAVPMVDAGRAVPLGASLVDAAVPPAAHGGAMAPTEGADNLARIGELELKSLEL